MRTHITTPILVLSLLTGCAPGDVVTLPNGEKRDCILKKCYREALAEKAAMERAEKEAADQKALEAYAAQEAAKKKAEEDARNAEIAAFKKRVPCELAFAFGVAVGPGSIHEYRDDPQYLAEMLTINPISCSFSRMGESSCSGFYLAKQMVRIDGPRWGRNKLVLITTNLPLTTGNVAAQLFISTDNLKCPGG